MLFSSNIFIFAFLPIVIFVYYVLLRRWRTAQNVFLFVASLFFYAWGEPTFVLVMMLSIVVNWLFGLAVDKVRDRKSAAYGVIAADVVFNLTIIFIFKYLMFTLQNMKLLFGLNDLVIPVIELPIGISFFTFQALSYVIDVYRKEGEAQKNLINVGLYISFFPQLIAGPIVRYRTVAEQIKNRKETFDDFSQGVVRFIVGLSKKVLIANSMAIVADFAFGTPGENSIAMAWLGAIAYSFQIYFDFSGYSDMAIGLGKMFGFHFLENFNYPYVSKSATEFWRRWHMSLGTWFRDYVYIPLGGNRTKTKMRHVFNIFVVWFCTGVWHGANWTFIVWGLMYFVLLIFEKFSPFDVRDEKGKHHVLKHVYLLFFVQCGWVIFRANTLGEAGLYFGDMFGAAPLIDDSFLEYFRQYAVYFVIAAIGSTPVVPKMKARLQEMGGKWETAGNVVAAIALVAMFLVSVSFIVKDTYSPFIYFNF